MNNQAIDSMETLSINRKKTTSQQEIAAYFRRKIRSGQLQAGQKLPTQTELANKLGVSGTTVHFAFQALIEEGLLVGRRALGTFVADRQPGLRQVGICYFGNNFSHPEHLYLRALHNELQKELDAAGVGMPVFQQAEWRNEGFTLSRELVQAVESRTLDGLIVPSINPVEREALEKLEIPSACNSSGNYANSVGFNGLQFLELAFAEIAAAGCRSVGLISALASDVVHKPQTGVHGYVAFTRHFVELAGSTGVAIKDAWVHCPENETVLRGMSHEEYGYEHTRRLLAQSERPESLIVYSDALARGAIIALLAEQEKAKNMTLILHKNRGVPLICPLPARFVVSSVADNAKALLQMIDRQFHGQSPGGPVRLPFALEK